MDTKTNDYSTTAPTKQEKHGITHDSASRGGSQGAAGVTSGYPTTREAREDINGGVPIKAQDMMSEQRDTGEDKKTAPATTGAAGGPQKGKKQQPPQQTQQQPPHLQQQQQSQQQGNRFAYPTMPSRQGPPFAPGPGGMPRGPYGGPPPYGYPNGNNGPYHHGPPQYCPPPPPPQMPPMPHYSGGGGGGPGGPYSTGPSMNNTRGPAPAPYYANPYQTNMSTAPFSHNNMPPYPNMTTSDSASISSKGSKSSKKRTIDGIHDGSSSNNANMSSLPGGGTAAAGGPPYTFRRTDSNSSTTSTVTAGNNTSMESHLTDESPHSKRDRSADLPPLNMGNMGFDEHHDDGNGGAAGGTGGTANRSQRTRYNTTNHRRDYSADASTASSLSVGGFSLASYERGVGAMEDAMISESKSTKKRMKGEDGASLLVDTSLRPPSVQSEDADHTTRFDQLSIDPKAPVSTKSDSTDGDKHQNLFLSLSTSPINQDVDATPISKNTSKKEQQLQQQQQATVVAAAASANVQAQQSTAKGNNASSIFKKKGAGAGAPKLDISTSDVARPTDTPTPPVHGEMGDTDMKFDDEHHTLNRHLRGQSFTPVCNLSANGEHGGAVDAQYNIAPQLSWSIAGDTPSLGDLAEWEEDHTQTNTSHNTTMATTSATNNGASNNTASSCSNKLKSVPAPVDLKIRPSSTTSNDSRNMTISPHELHLWKGEHELMDQAINGATTPLPLPAFFESRSETENKYTSFDANIHSKRKNGDALDHHIPHPAMSHSNGTTHITIGKPPSTTSSSNKPVPPLVWSKSTDHHHPPQLNTQVGSMPPTPLFAAGAVNDFRDDAFARSPYGEDRRDGSFPFFHHHPHHPPSTSHSNGRVRNLRGRMPPGAHFPPMLHIPPPMSAQLPMTSPMALPNKAGLWSPHGGMPPMSSPHHMASPLNSMSQSKRKCVPLKPPIPSKFQGDLEKVKGTPLPEFTSLVNFPVHMSQKQSVNLPEGMRCCVMCGQACPCSNGGKSKKKKATGPNEGGSFGVPPPNSGGLVPRSSNTSQDFMNDKNNGYAIIPTQNKGLCTLCDVNVWVVVSSGLEIKWCKGCKNFRPWAAFGDKGLATKCLRCRERQREKYALQKEEKEKSRAIKAKK